MPRKNWNRLQANSFRHATELCVDYARTNKNLSIDRIADLMGVESKWALYKWMENGRIPGILIRPFENACGIDYITRYLAHSENKLLVVIPTGKKATNKEISELGSAISETNRLLNCYHTGESEAEETISAIVSIMEDLAYHKGNIEKDNQPELELH